MLKLWRLSSLSSFFSVSKTRLDAKPHTVLIRVLHGSDLSLVWLAVVLCVASFIRCVLFFSA